MKTRVISAAVIMVFVAAVVVFNRIFTPALNIAVALVSVLAVYEITSALGLAKKYMLLIPSLIFALLLPILQPEFLHVTVYYIYTVTLFATMIFYHDQVTFREVGVIYSMTMLIPTALSTLLSIRQVGGRHGMFYVLVAIFAAWASDVGAFLVGSFFGKHKLCPNISPKKTVEGVIGGLVTNVGAMLAFGYLFQVVFYNYSVRISFLPLIIIGAAGSLLSVLGDLSFSLIKRSCHIKDFGEMIPGHGGILDRFDSVIFVAPFVLFVLKIMPIVQ